MHGGDIYNNKVNMDFSVNLNPLGTLELVKKAIIDSIENIANYPENGAQTLKKQLASSLKLCSDRLLMTNGASEAFMAIVRAIEPKCAMVFDPCFSGYEYVLNGKEIDIYHGNLEEFESLGNFLESYKNSLCQELDEGKLSSNICETFYSLDDFINIYNRICNDRRDSEIECEKLQKNAIVFITNPNNPNGKCIDADKLKSIVEKLSENGIYSVIDECFLPLTDRIDESFLGIDNHYVIVVRSFTKAYAIPGIRLGYIYTSNINIIKKISMELPEWNLSIPAMAAGGACLRESGYLDRAREVIRTEGIRLREELEKLGLKTYPTDTCFIMFEGPKDLYHKMLDKGVLIRDLSDYIGLGKGYYRIAVKTGSENDELLRIMKEVLQ